MTAKLANPKRGCGHLKRGKAYIRGAGFSPDGVLPAFVACEPAIPFKEIGTDGSFTRGFERIDGLSLQLATNDELCQYIPLTNAGRYEESDALSNMVGMGLYDDKDAIPEHEVHRHIDRVEARGPEGYHWGDIPTASQTDLLMRAGESYYPDPEDFITECVEHGLSKAIPVTPNRKPPTIVSGITRCWVMHPNALDDGEFGGGIIGYAYLREVVFTEPEAGDLPQYIDEFTDQDLLAVRDVEAPQDDEGDAQQHVEDYKA